MKAASLPLLVVALLAATLAISQDNEFEPVQMAVLTAENWEEFAPLGKEVDAIYGDIVIRNEHVTAVIARPISTRNANMTVRNVGGCLIDLTARNFESDQLSCFYSAGPDFPYSSWNYSIDDRQPGDVTGDLSVAGDRVSVTVSSPATADRPQALTSYSLDRGSRALVVKTTFINDSKKTLTIIPTDHIRADGGKEDMVKSPNGTHDVFDIDDRYWQQAYLITAPERTIQSNSDSRTSRLKYLSANGQDVQAISPGGSFTLQRWIAPGRTRTDAWSALHPQDSQRIQLSVLNAKGEALQEAFVEISHAGKLVGTIRLDDERRAQLSVPVGELEFRVLHNGRAIQSLSQTVARADTPVDVSLRLSEYTPGVLNVTVVDGADQQLPAKIEIVGLPDEMTPNFGPETAEFAVRNLRYAPHGQFDQSLAPGEYLLRVSHGPEFSATEANVQIAAGEVSNTSFQLHRLIDTTGWVSSDFHSHSTPSGDNTSSQLGRVLNLVCEHIEYAPCTEHNRIDTYQPHFDALNINAFISSTTGMELTGSPLPLNHQNVFPLHHHPHRQDGGGPVTDSDVATQIRRVATWDNGSEKLVQQNHPDVGWLFYDKNGDGEHDQGHADAVAFIDVMEIHPVDRVLQTGTLDDVTADEAKSNRIFKWLQLLNQGYRIPGVTNTDAHYNFHGSGWLRVWIRSSTDEPAMIDTMEMVHASEAGQVIMSNGPFLTLTAKNEDGKTVDIGQDLTASNQTVTVDLSVQCPNWFRVDTVFLLLNGRTREDLLFTQASHPELFVEKGEGDRRVQSFRKTLKLKLDEDTHIVAVTGGASTTLGPVFGPQWGKVPPAALTNPIFVDIDGDGFTPNKDTLGRPLPVKGD